MPWLVESREVLQPKDQILHLPLLRLSACCFVDYRSSFFVAPGRVGRDGTGEGTNGGKLGVWVTATCEERNRWWRTMINIFLCYWLLLPPWGSGTVHPVRFSRFPPLPPKLLVMLSVQATPTIPPAPILSKISMFISILHVAPHHFYSLWFNSLPHQPSSQLFKVFNFLSIQFYSPRPTTRFSSFVTVNISKLHEFFFIEPEPWFQSFTFWFSCR